MMPATLALPTAGVEAKTALQVTEPGAYLWVDRFGVRHVGFVTKNRGDRLSGAFVSDSGCIRAVSMRPDDDTDSGKFYGPLQLPTEN